MRSSVSRTTRVCQSSSVGTRRTSKTSGPCHVPRASKYPSDGVRHTTKLVLERGVSRFIHYLYTCIYPYLHLKLQRPQDDQTDALKQTLMKCSSICADKCYERTTLGSTILKIKMTNLIRIPYPTIKSEGEGARTQVIDLDVLSYRFSAALPHR